MWYLFPKVYFVKGAKRAAFYDLNRNAIYQLTSGAKELVVRALNNNGQDCFSEKENVFLEKLVKNDLISHDFYESRDISELAEPTHIEFAWIEVTDLCNLKCIHCYEEAKCEHGKILPYEEYCHIIDELQNNDIKKVQLIGGEPFVLGNRIFKYIDYLKGKFSFVEIFTNGTLIRPEWISYFRDNHIHFALSVYSNIPEMHNKVTKDKTSWQRTNRTIQLLHDAGIPYRICNVLMRGIDLGENNNPLYKLNPEKDVVRLTGRGNISLLTADLIKKRIITKETFSKPIFKAFLQRAISGHNCFARSIYISLDSEVYPCVMERRVSHGNLKRDSLSKILNDNITSLTKDGINGCKDCELRYACFDCRPNSNGAGFYDKPWYCTYNPDEGIWLDSEKYIHSILNPVK